MLFGPPRATGANCKQIIGKHRRANYTNIRNRPNNGRRSQFGASANSNIPAALVRTAFVALLAALLFVD